MCATNWNTNTSHKQYNAKPKMHDLTKKEERKNDKKRSVCVGRAVKVTAYACNSNQPWQLVDSGITMDNCLWSCVRNNCHNVAWDLLKPGYSLFIFKVGYCKKLQDFMRFKSKTTKVKIIGIFLSSHIEAYLFLIWEKVSIAAGRTGVLYFVSVVRLLAPQGITSSGR